MAISMANYRHARLRGAETSAIGALTAINQAQFAYMQTCGNQKFAPHLTSARQAQSRHDTRLSESRPDGR